MATLTLTSASEALSFSTIVNIYADGLSANTRYDIYVKRGTSSYTWGQTFTSNASGEISYALSENARGAQFVQYVSPADDGSFVLAGKINEYGTSTTIATGTLTLRYVNTLVAPGLNDFDYSIVSTPDIGVVVQNETVLSITVAGLSKARKQFSSVTLSCEGVETTKSTYGTLDSTLNGYVATETFELPKLSQTGRINATVTFTDRMGFCFSYRPLITVNAYGAPTLSGVDVIRAVLVTPAVGEAYWEADDSGERVLTSLVATHTDLDGLNSATLGCVYTDDEGVSQSLGIDGASFTLDPDVISAAISASKRYEFVFTLTDSFHSDVKRVIVDKASAYFDVEQYGVAVGMRSTGDAETKKFEVAEDYETHFYGDVFDKNGNNIAGYANEQHWASGAALASGWQAGTGGVHIVRRGDLVNICGYIKPTANFSSSYQTWINLPDWAKSAYYVDFIGIVNHYMPVHHRCQGGSFYCWRPYVGSTAQTWSSGTEGYVNVTYKGIEL